MPRNLGLCQGCGGVLDERGSDICPTGGHCPIERGVRFISADEWPKTERSLVECSNVIYFRDFLRSFWKRLTKRLLP